MMVGITVPLVMGRWPRRSRSGHVTRTCHAPALAISQHAHEGCEASLGPESTKELLHRTSTGLVRADTRNDKHTLVSKARRDSSATLHWRLDRLLVLSLIHISE